MGTYELEISRFKDYVTHNRLDRAEWLLSDYMEMKCVDLSEEFRIVVENEDFKAAEWILDKELILPEDIVNAMIKSARKKMTFFEIYQRRGYNLTDDELTRLFTSSILDNDLEMTEFLLDGRIDVSDELYQEIFRLLLQNEVSTSFDFVLHRAEIPDEILVEGFKWILEEGYDTETAQWILDQGRQLDFSDIDFSEYIQKLVPYSSFSNFLIRNGFASASDIPLDNVKNIVINFIESGNTYIREVLYILDNDSRVVNSLSINQLRLLFGKLIRDKRNYQRILNILEGRSDSEEVNFRDILYNRLYALDFDAANFIMDNKLNISGLNLRYVYDNVNYEAQLWITNRPEFQDTFNPIL